MEIMEYCLKMISVCISAVLLGCSACSEAELSGGQPNGMMNASPLDQAAPSSEATTHSGRQPADDKAERPKPLPQPSDAPQRQDQGLHAGQPGFNLRQKQDQQLQAGLDELNRGYVQDIDLDGDDIQETVIYEPATLQLCVYRDGILISSTGIPQFGMTFNYIGPGDLFSYCYSFVKDQGGNVLLHTVSRTLFDDTYDVMVGCSHDYYGFQEGGWIKKHTIGCTEINGTRYEDVTLDGQPMEDLESVWNLFTEIAVAFRAI